VALLAGKVRSTPAAPWLACWRLALNEDGLTSLVPVDAGMIGGSVLGTPAATNNSVIYLIVTDLSRRGSSL
jgi:hypothetical protein